MMLFILGAIVGVVCFACGWRASRRAIYREELQKIGLANLQRQAEDARAVLAEVSFSR